MSIKGMNNIIKISSVKIILELYEFTKIKPKNIHKGKSQYYLKKLYFYSLIKIIIRKL